MSGIVRLTALRPQRLSRARSLAALACALSLAACGSSSKTTQSGPHPGIQLSTGTLLTTEGGSNVSFTVSLGAQPSSIVDVDVLSNDYTEGLLLGPGDTYASSWTSLTFTPTNWNVPQTVQVVPQRDYIVDGNITYTITASVWTMDPTWLAVPNATVSVTNADADIPVIALSKTTATTSENGTTDSFTVVLGTKPSATVTVPVTSLDTTEGLVRGGNSPTTSQPSINLTFTTYDWNVPQTVTVYGQNDNIADGNQTYGVQVGPATGAAEYVPLGAQTVQVTNQDNDVAGVSVIAAASPLVTSENGTTATFTVKLNTEPTADVVVPVTSGNVAEGLLSSGAQNLQTTVNLTFTGGVSGNWNTPQTVTVTGQDDLASPVYGDNVTYAVTVGAPTGAAEYLAVAAQSVSVLNLDNDTPAFIVPQAGGTALQTSESGTTATFTVWLNKAPTADVTIPVTTGDSTEGLVMGGSSPTTPASTITLTFTTADWQTPKTVTVVGQPDVIVDGNQTYAITVGPTTSTDTSFNGLAAKTISVTNADVNTAGFTVSTTSVWTTEGGAVATFTVKLNTQPYQNVTIPVSSGDATEGKLMGGDSAGAYQPSINLTFTPANWQTAQTVTVQGQPDNMVDGTQYYTITVGPTASADTPYQGLAAKTVSGTNYDVDVAGFTVTPTTGLVTTEAGGTAMFTVKLNTIPTGTVNVPVSVDDTSEALVSAGGTPTGFLTLAFDSFNWNVAQTITVTGQGDGILDGNRPFVVSVGPTNSGDTHYNNLTAKTVSGTNTDAQSGVSQGTANSPVSIAFTSLPYAGQCGGTSGTSYYQVTGLTPGGAALVSLLNVTAAVMLTVDDDGNYSTGNLCNASVAAFASGSCTATVPASGNLWVRVSTSASGGAGYTLNVPVGATYVSTDVPKAIPDGNSTGVTSAITVSGGVTALSKVTVKLSITHTYDSDLSIYLISPAGTQVLLSSNNGGSLDNYTNTVFDDDAATSIWSGSAPFTGTFKPEGTLSTLAGQNANGTWLLKVVDWYTPDTGTIDAFSLSIW